MLPNLPGPFSMTGKNLGNLGKLMTLSEVKHSQSCPGDTSNPWAGD